MALSQSSDTDQKHGLVGRSANYDLEAACFYKWFYWDTGPPVSYCLWLLSLYNNRSWEVVTETTGPKAWNIHPFKKTFADSWPTVQKKRSEMFIWGMCSWEEGQERNNGAIFPIRRIPIEHLVYAKHWDSGLRGGNNTMNKTDKAPTLLNLTVEATGGNNMITASTFSGWERKERWTMGAGVGTGDPGKEYWARPTENWDSTPHRDQRCSTWLGMADAVR